MPGKIIYCESCGEQIDSSNSLCPYCGDVVQLPDENDYVPEEDISVDFTSELFEEVDGKIIKVNIKSEQSTASASPMDSTLETPQESMHIVGSSPFESSLAKETGPNTGSMSTSQSPLTQAQNITTRTGGYKPVNMHRQVSEEAMVTPVIKAPPKRNRQGKIIAYDANYDHYWDDVKPAIDDVIKENHFDIILKIVGTFLLVLLLIVYLIFFLPSF